MKEIVFKIDEDGEIHLEVKGTLGQACDDLTQPFEVELGVVSQKTRKAEYYSDELSVTEVGDAGHDH